jgi:UDP-N-acetylmuramate dehydrogenase
VEIERDVLLGRFSTFRVGGPARFFARVKTVEQLEEALAFARREELPHWILGCGSNTLFDDRGYAGLVVLNQIDQLEQREQWVRVGAGYRFNRLAVVTAAAGWAGLEFGAAIPGSVGGAVYMNAGASGQETGQVLREVTCIDSAGNRVVHRCEGMPFGYRQSPFQKGLGAIVEALFELTSDPSARERQQQMLSHRRLTQPLADKSAGCAFRNPAGHSAGALIDQCGLKGTLLGDAQVSPIHANFIVNRGGATCEQIRTLIAQVKEAVFKQHQVELEEELRYLPYNG